MRLIHGPDVSDGVKADETCPFENRRAQKLKVSSIRPLLVCCPSESQSHLVGFECIRVQF